MLNLPLCGGLRPERGHLSVMVTGFANRVGRLATERHMNLLLVRLPELTARSVSR